MYLSKLVFCAKKAIHKDVYDAHQALWALYSDNPQRKRDFLYRELDPTTYLCLSAREPEDGKGIWRMAVKPFDPKLAEGDRLYVSLRANAVVKRRTAAGRQVRYDVVQDARKRFEERGEPVPPRVELAQEQGVRWLLDRQEAMGLYFEDLSLAVTSYMVRRTWHAGKDISLGTLDFTGFAVVDDVDKALKSLREGVGPAKGFGCGLLLIRRA